MRKANCGFRAGDIVKTRKGVVWHVMLALGDGWFLEKTRFGQVRKRHRSSWGASQRFVLVERPAASVARRAVRRGLGRIGPEVYCLFDANCEHFVHDLVYGEAKSSQVERLMRGLGVLAGFAVVSLVGA